MRVVLASVAFVAFFAYNPPDAAAQITVQFGSQGYYQPGDYYQNQYVPYQYGTQSFLNAPSISNFVNPGYSSYYTPQYVNPGYYPGYNNFGGYNGYNRGFNGGFNNYRGFTNPNGFRFR